MHKKPIVYPYIPNSVPEIKEAMMKEVGVTDPMQLYEEIPEHLKYHKEMQLPKPILDEYSIRRHTEELLGKNKTCGEHLSFLGAGCAQHFVPAVCDTFYPRDVNKQSVSGNNVQAGTDMRDSVMADDNLGINAADSSHIYESSASNLTPLVVCNVDDCKYWQHDVCKAEDITIDGAEAAISGDTRCKTYNPK